MVASSHGCSITYCLVAALALVSVPGASGREEYYSEFKACPVACSSTQDPSQWTLYSSLERLTYCLEPVLFEVSLSGAPATRQQSTRVRACTTKDADKDERVIVNAIVPPPEYIEERLGRRHVGCPAPTKNSTLLELVSWGGRGSAAVADNTLRGLSELEPWIQKTKGCENGSKVLFSHINGTVLGYFGGSRVDAGSTTSFFDTIRSEVSENGAPRRLALQHCVPEGKTTTTLTGGVTLGVVADTQGGFVAVQKVLRAWNEGHCFGDSESSSKTIGDIDLQFYPSIQHTDSPAVVHGGNGTDLVARQDGPGVCRWIRVEHGDECPSLAVKCRITGDQYMQVNPQDGHCSSLQPGQPVCCSRGRLPEIRPRQRADGSCFPYETKLGDSCSFIAASNGLKQSDLFDFNDDKTWGWNGCHPLGLGINLCLSPGTPPAPLPVDNAVCGPTKPNTKVTPGQNITQLNPCPLRACCSVWGHCGTTAEFCTIHRSKTGAPGTPGPDGNNCASNCGMDILNNDDPPSKFYKLGYFEGWNKNRDCLHMDARSLPDHRQRYTDIHFAFAHIGPGPDFEVVIPDDSKVQFESFVNIRGPNRIIAIGGWTFSAEEPHFRRFREATRPENRERFAINCATFAMRHGLDGIDFDWEYPSAPDLPAHEPGEEDEAENYYEFLKVVKRWMPDLMSLSIAAPASFWYLKQFPIREMHPYLDYIVYMTYDLHGQWDAGNPWSNPGCPTGSCLRSHVNWTETHNALAMITKAGVPANKVLMGVATYGRSFKMAQAGCDGPNCLFLGDRDNSQAKKGRCTDTAGYLANAEIFEQIDKGYTRRWADSSTRANYLVYEGTEWVSYMDNTNRQWRENQAKRLNFGGTIEWAVDLQEFLEDGGMADTRDNLWEPKPGCRDSSPHDNLEDLEKDNSIPAFCLPLYALEILRKLADGFLDHYDRLIDDGYDSNFLKYREAAMRSTRAEVDGWVLENADKYFDCSGSETLPCCADCGTRCFGGCISSHQSDWCRNGGAYDTWRFEAECPPTRKILPTTGGDITFTFKDDSKEEEFYGEILEKFGVAKDRMLPSRYTYKSYQEGFPRLECSNPWGSDCTHAKYLNIPMAANYRVSHVPNPKELMEMGAENAGDLPATLRGYEWGIRTGVLQDEPSVIVDALTVPVLILGEAVKNMQEVYDIAEEIKEREDKDLILAVVQLIFFIVPFIGKVAGAMTATALYIRTVANLIGDLGLIAVDIYKIVEAETDEERAVLGLGIGLTGLGSLTNIPSIREAGKLRRNTPTVVIEKMYVNLNGVRSSRNAMDKAQKICPRYA